MGQYLKNKRSSSVVNGAPKLPTSSQIDYGEIAINFAKGYETISIKNNNGEIVPFSSDSALDKKYIESGAVVTALAGISTDSFFDDAEYDSNTKRINFKNNGTVKDYIDATDFIKDGMVDDVEIGTPSAGTNSGVSCLIVTFNTDAGKEDIEIPIANIFNPSNYYTKSQNDTLFVPWSGGTMGERDILRFTLDTEDDYDAYVEMYPGTVEVGAENNEHNMYTTLDAGDVVMWADNEKSIELYVGAPLIRLSNVTGHDETNIYIDHITRGYAGDYNTINFPSQSGTLAVVSEIPTESDLVASGFTKNALTAYTETDPTVASWAKQPSKPTYTASEIGALPDTTDIPTEAKIAGSGFTKNAGTLTGVTINNTAATVSNGNASITIPKELPTVSSSDNGKVLMVVNGQWSAATPIVVYTGDAAPNNSLGNNGDIYLQTS